MMSSGKAKLVIFDPNLQEVKVQLQGSRKAGWNNRKISHSNMKCLFLFVRSTTEGPGKGYFKRVCEGSVKAENAHTKAQKSQAKGELICSDMAMDLGMMRRKSRVVGKVNIIKFPFILLLILRAYVLHYKSKKIDISKNKTANRYT